MSRNHIIVVSLVIAAVASGCYLKTRPMHSTQPNPQSTAMSDVTERMGELQTRAVEFSAVARSLPGRDAGEDRKLTAQALERASAALVLLGGPTPGGAFRQSVRIIDNVRQQLSRTSGTMPDPTLDSGLRALCNALVDVRERLFATDAKTGQLLDALRERIDDLDAVRGPLHSVAAARAFAAVADVVEAMANDLQGRVTAASQPAGK